MRLAIGMRTAPICDIEGGPDVETITSHTMRCRRQIKGKFKLRWERTRNGGIWGGETVRPAQNSIKQKFILEKYFRHNFSFSDLQRKQKLVVRVQKKVFDHFNSDSQWALLMAITIFKCKVNWSNNPHYALNFETEEISWIQGGFGSWEGLVSLKCPQSCSCHALEEVSWLLGSNHLRLYILLDEIYWVPVLAFYWLRKSSHAGRE